MSEGSCNCGSQLANLDSRVTWLEHQIQRIEAEMTEIAQAIRDVGGFLGGKIDSTNSHLKIVQAEVAAVGVGIVAVKVSADKGFAETQKLQERQTSAMVQLDSVKTYTEAVALSNKAVAFSGEVDGRFNKAVEGVVLNRILYDKHFGAIHEEYGAKLRAIGSHIYAIWEQDFSRLEETARVPTSAYAQVSFEVDLQRLASRSAQLDQDLEMIRTQHLEPLVALEATFDRRVRESYALEGAREGDAYYVPAVVALTTDGADVTVDRRVVAQPDSAAGAMAELEPLGRAPLVAAYCASEEARERVRRDCRTRPMTDAEKAELMAAIGRLAERGLVSPRLAPGFIQYIGGVQISIVDGAVEDRTVACA